MIPAIFLRTILRLSLPSINRSPPSYGRCFFVKQKYNLQTHNIMSSSNKIKHFNVGGDPNGSRVDRIACRLLFLDGCCGCKHDLAQGYSGGLFDRDFSIGIGSDKVFYSGCEWNFSIISLYLGPIIRSDFSNCHDCSHDRSIAKVRGQ